MKNIFKKLMDGELAANNGGWQWSASTERMQLPYFRIFSPNGQSQKFDPQGEFIKVCARVEVCYLRKRFMLLEECQRLSCSIGRPCSGTG
ncbi:MAG: FAD-binding domain-containing protein [Verrucomicrobiia bacterium]